MQEILGGLNNVERGAYVSTKNRATPKLHFNKINKILTDEK